LLSNQGKADDAYPLRGAFTLGFLRRGISVMNFYRSNCVPTSVVAIVLLNAVMAMGEEPKAAAELVEFKSEEGKFSIKLPGKPEHEVVEVGNDKGKQHQFTVDLGRGVYLISYQDNPKLEGSTPKQLAAALEVGRDQLKKTFQGELLENKTLTLGKTHPGLDSRWTIPAANGEARCRFYMVGTRLYQIMAIGVPDFANSADATQVIESFKLLK
jgi:hypothetical protein